jgi:hypothetical protein
MLEEMDVIRLGLSSELVSRVFQATAVKMGGAMKPNFTKAWCAKCQ